MKQSRFYYSRPCYTLEMGVVDSGIPDMNRNTLVLFDLGAPLKPKPRLTVCGILDTDEETLSFSAALCSPLDRFEKSIGRKIAEERALQNPVLVVPVTKETTPIIFMECARQLEAYILGKESTYVLKREQMLDYTLNEENGEIEIHF